MYSIDKISKNIFSELNETRENLSDDDYKQLRNNKNLVVNFDNNDVYLMDKNSSLNPNR